MKKVLLGVSILVNVLFVIGWLNNPRNKIGRLEKDVRVGYFSSDSAFFTLPKGLSVRCASEWGLSAIGQFENERFEIVITSDDPEIVNYNVPRNELQPFGNMYSADGIGRR